MNNHMAIYKTPNDTCDKEYLESCKKASEIFIREESPNMEYTYGCEGKKYHVEYYPNQLERQNRYGMTCKVNGIIENFNPSTQTAIKTSAGDLILIDSRLISNMRPMSRFELKEFEKGNIEDE